MAQKTVLERLSQDVTVLGVVEVRVVVLDLLEESCADFGGVH